MKFLAVALAVLCSLTAVSAEDAAPSSHMVYNDASFPGDILINEVRVPRDGEAMNTYYEALGWSGKGAGYAGIQCHSRGHNYIFSIWDHKEHSAPIRAVHVGAGTLTENFGGEGTGLKSWNFELGWETDQWYTLAARCWPVGEHTEYGFWVRAERSGAWTHLVTMDVAANEAYFHGGNDSFIEDWLETGKNSRTTHLRNGWKRKPSGEWHAFQTAAYSVNRWDLEAGKRSFNYRTNWNGGVAKDESGAFYFMTAGGAETKPQVANPSTHSIPRTEKTPTYPPIKIRSASVQFTDGGLARIEWDLDPTTLPQFRYAVTAYNLSAGSDVPVAEVQRVEPHARSAELTLPAGLDRDQLRIVLRCRDILDHDSEPVRVSETKVAN